MGQSALRTREVEAVTIKAMRLFHAPVFVFLVLSSCAAPSPVRSGSLTKTLRIRSERETMLSLVQVGDDIFQSKEKLKENGFNIKFGPELSNVQKSRYLMIVDYGVAPGPIATLGEALGSGGDGKPISGAIYADRSGRIFRIR